MRASLEIAERQKHRSVKVHCLYGFLSSLIVKQCMRLGEVTKSSVLHFFLLPKLSGFCGAEADETILRLTEVSRTQKCKNAKMHRPTYYPLYLMYPQYLRGWNTI